MQEKSTENKADFVLCGDVVANERDSLRPCIK